MSKIVAFRDRIIDTIKDSIPELLDVSWYDGIFDEKDVEEWVLKTPAARVAVMNVPTDHHSTMELNANLRVVVVIIDENRRRSDDADARNWDIIEKLAVLANLNTFGDPDAAAATRVKFQRLSDADLRKDGIALGVVEWESGLTIGRNRVRERDFIYHNGQMVTQVPKTKVTGQLVIRRGDDEEGGDTLDVTPEED